MDYAQIYSLITAQDKEFINGLAKAALQMSAASCGDIAADLMKERDVSLADVRHQTSAETIVGFAQDYTTDMLTDFEAVFRKTLHDLGDSLTVQVRTDINPTITFG